jgi:hypothetical protein
MYHQKRNLLIFNNNSLADKLLNQILSMAESKEHFCTAHELVNRNHITNNRKKIWNESRRPELRPFRFLINKN